MFPSTRRGAYTGEVSAAQLADIGAKYCIVGHSERRQYHGEDDMLINAKVKALIERASSPSSASARALSSARWISLWNMLHIRSKAALSGVDASQLRRCIIAYEPIWAIGTGKTATAEQAEEVCQGIRAVVRGIYGRAPHVRSAFSTAVA